MSDVQRPAGAPDGATEPLISLARLREWVAHEYDLEDEEERDSAAVWTALIDAVEAAQEAWSWIDAVARSVDDHQLAHGATTARQALSIKLLPFEESVSEYGR